MPGNFPSVAGRNTYVRIGPLGVGMSITSSLMVITAALLRRDAGVIRSEIELRLAVAAHDHLHRAHALHVVLARGRDRRHFFAADVVNVNRDRTFLGIAGLRLAE